MKVKNEYVQINIGDKKYIRKNMLFNIYLKRLFEAQIEPIHDDSRINTCYLKLDTPIENVDYDTELDASEFEVKFSGIGVDFQPKDFEKMAILDKNYIKIKYIFDNKNNFEYKGNTYDANYLEMLNGKRITGIAFGFESYIGLESQNAIFSYIDTSNMNMIINRGEGLSIVRVDTFESDAICRGNDFPLHIANDTAFWAMPLGKKAQLYSVGFGNVLGEMEEEYLISNLETTIDDTSISFDLSRNRNVGEYPSSNLYTGFTPVKDNSKYLIFKYRLYNIDVYNVITYYDEYYTMNMPNDNFGDLNIKLKIERS